MRLVDVVPTACHFLGIEPPGQCEGHALLDLVEGHEAARSRPAVTPSLGEETTDAIWTQRDMHDFSPLER
jgi:arylsulfatase A-like enzyme